MKPLTQSMLAQPVVLVYKKKRFVLHSKENLNRSTYKLTHSSIFAVRTQGHSFAFTIEKKKTASFHIQFTKPLLFVKATD